MSSLPLWALLLVFAAGAAATWIAGIKLSEATDVLDDRLHIGSAFGGLIVLAVATNLPEIAITVSAAISGNLEVAVGNILGGIALQTVVIAILDLFGRRGEGVPPLTYRAASLTLVLEALLVVMILSIVVAGTQLPSSLEAFHLTPDVVLIAVVWFGGLLLVRRAGRGLPWHEAGEAPDASPHDQGHRRADPPDAGSTTKASTTRTVLVFAAAALTTLVAGVLLERSGDAAADQLGVSGLLFGATVLALATSLPEISTGLQAIKQGDDNLAISDIFGGNAFLPVLLLVATLITGQAVLAGAEAANVYLTAVAAVLTLVYAIGLIMRPRRRLAGMGVDSVVVVGVYIVALGGLAVLG